MPIYTLIILTSGLFALGQVDEYSIAKGPPDFGEQPLVRGNIIVWQRCGAEPGSQGRIQFMDISRLENPIRDVVEYPAALGGVILSATHLFWGAQGLPEKIPVVARPIGDLTISVADVKVVTDFRDETRLGRTQAASDEYVVWEDRDPDIPQDTWKIYSKAITQLGSLGAKRLIVDTHLPDLGAYLALHGSLLIYEGLRENGAGVGIFLLHLESQDPPAVLPHSVEWGVTWPAISGEYAIWTERSYTEKDGFLRRLRGVRLIDGRPEGDLLVISTEASGGSWPEIDKNIVVWNGGTRLQDGGFDHSAIMAAELPLPGADDVGDVNQDGQIDVTDVINILNYLFLGGWQPRRRLADADANGAIDLSDAMVILRYLFLGGNKG